MLGTQDKNQLSISAGLILKVALVAFALWMVYLLKSVVLVFFTALVIASAVEPITARLKSWGIPRTFGVILIYLVAVALFVFSVYFFIPPMVEEVSNLSIELPGYFEDLTIRGGSAVEHGTISVGQLLSDLREGLSDLSSGTISVLSRFFGGALSFLLILIISFYLAVQERGIENFIRVISPITVEEYVINLWRRAQRKIGLWFQGQLALMLIVGVLVFLGLIMIKMKFALTLALLAALFEIIPIFGPILAAVPAVLIGFSISPTLGFMAIGLYLIVQWLENHFIYPVVVNKIVGVPPLVVVLAIIVGGTLAGFLGIILAIPAASIILELFHDLEKEKEKLPKIS